MTRFVDASTLKWFAPSTKQNRTLGFVARRIARRSVALVSFRPSMTHVRRRIGSHRPYRPGESRQ
jgi:hypothetical protein